MKLIKIQQSFRGEKVRDIKDTVAQEILQSDIRLNRGSKIAIAVGSRGIANISVIVKKVIESITKMGSETFIVPAMGSHGNATAEGQVEILSHLGICRETMGVPILSSMEVVELPGGGQKNRIFMDRHAYDSDGVILINRIKPHTDFFGPYESGLVKMCVIGLGKHKQALEIHRFGINGLRDLLPATAQKIFSTGKIILGLGIVENACDETAIIRALRPENILNEEPKLLEYAKKNMPSFPVDNIDVLIVDRLGKDISGTGLDPNIIGRMGIRDLKDLEKPRIKSIIVTDITSASHGNALGVGFADVITEKLYGKIDFSATYENVVTSTFLERGKIPVIAKNARKAFEIVLRTSGPLLAGKERVIRIRDTLNLEYMYVSEAILDEIKGTVTVYGNFENIFKKNGELKDFL